MDDDQKELEAAANKLFKAAAEAAGVPLNQWLRENGILSPAHRRNIRRREVPLKEDR